MKKSYSLQLTVYGLQMITFAGGMASG